MRRQSIAILCAAGLILTSGWAAAEDHPATQAPPKAASDAAHVVHHHRASKPPKTAPSAGDTPQASANEGVVKQAVKTGGALNDKGMKVLPP